MAYYRINGGKRLEGAVTISGAKNASLAIIPAVILSGESCLLENLPEIEDVRIVEEILTSMGADISRTPDGSMRIDPSGISTFSVTGEMVSSMRASYYLLGALLGRYKKAEIALPGGCAIGQRPIDQHIKGMRALGADIVIQGGSVKARADRLRGAEIYLRAPEPIRPCLYGAALYHYIRAQRPHALYMLVYGPLAYGAAAGKGYLRLLIPAQQRP